VLLFVFGGVDVLLMGVLFVVAAVVLMLLWCCCCCCCVVFVVLFYKNTSKYILLSLENCVWFACSIWMIWNILANPKPIMLLPSSGC